MEILEGGRTGEIFKDGQTVVRPAGRWSPTVHRFLLHLRANGFMQVPKPISITEDGKEIVSYLQGRVCEDLRDSVAGSHGVLVSAARCLRTFHEAAAGFLENDDLPQIWMLAPRQPREIVCHGDFAPYNVTLAGPSVSGIIDFDTAHPAPRLWDLAYAVYRWAPLSDPANALVPFDSRLSWNAPELFALNTAPRRKSGLRSRTSYIKGCSALSAS